MGPRDPNSVPLRAAQVTPSTEGQKSQTGEAWVFYSRGLIPLSSENWDPVAGMLVQKQEYSSQTF